VQEYYILDELNPPGRSCETAFYRLGPGGIYQPILPVNGIIQSTVLPGFQFRIDDLEKRPNPLETLDDSIYQAFTSPYLRAERERAEEELEAAEQELECIEQELEVERERAEQSIKQAEQAQDINEQIKAYLKTQGISLPEHLQSGDL